MPKSLITPELQTAAQDLVDIHLPEFGGPDDHKVRLAIYVKLLADFPGVKIGTIRQAVAKAERVRNGRAVSGRR